MKLGRSVNSKQQGSTRSISCPNKGYKTNTCSFNNDLGWFPNSVQRTSVGYIRCSTASISSILSLLCVCGCSVLQ